MRIEGSLPVSIREGYYNGYVSRSTYNKNKITPVNANPKNANHEDATIHTDQNVANITSTDQQVIDNIEQQAQTVDIQSSDKQPVDES